MSSAIPASNLPTVQFDAQLVRKLSTPGPRYSCYPSPEHFSSDFCYRDYLQAVAGRRTRGNGRGLSLYLHIPFCDTLCYYCSCHKIVTRQRDKATVYLSYLKREIEMQGALLAGVNQVDQLHLGGGTPTYLSDAQMGDLMAHVRRKFVFAPDAVGEYSIEVDPRTVSPERVHSLRRQGFNRISIGVQDYDDAVQQAVNRILPQAHAEAIAGAARAAGFRSVGIDLIYGLPKQTVMSIAQTLAKVIDSGADRIALYNYSHLPQLFKDQRRIDDADLPAAAVKLDMLALCIRRLTAAGYVYIGMDQFVKPEDDLAVAQRQGRLHRNFHGYSTHAETDLVACGISAISAVGPTYSQNVKTLEAYYERLDNNELPIARGIELSMDDALRRSLMQMLMCQFELSFGAIEQAFPIVFADYFAPELARLHALAAAGLLVIGPEFMSVTLRGRLLIRTICMVFDRYLNEKASPR